MAKKTILVTGSTGWLGGKLCEALVARGVNVVGLQRFFAAADTANLRITHKERNQWGCDGYRCVEYALVSESFLREANGAVMCATEAA